MSFHFGYEETILFEFWKISTIGGLIGSMVGIFILAMLYEGLKYFRLVCEKGMYSCTGRGTKGGRAGKEREIEVKEGDWGRERRGKGW